MKKIFTLLFAVGLFTMANAQPGQRDNRNGNDREVIKVVVNDNDRYDNDRYDNDRYGNSTFSNERRIRMQIAEINREYDYKIQKVRNSFFLNRWEKQRQIRFLDNRRDQEIRMVYAKFKNKGRHNDRDRDFPNNRHY